MNKLIRTTIGVAVASGLIAAPAYATTINGLTEIDENLETENNEQVVTLSEEELLQEETVSETPDTSSETPDTSEIITEELELNDETPEDFTEIDTLHTLLTDEDGNPYFVDEFTEEISEGADGEPMARITFAQDMRNKVTSLGGGYITVKTANVVCNMSAAIGCATYPTTITFANRLANYSQSQKWAVAAHEYGHIRHFDQWEQVNAHPTYKSAFGSDPELLADCIARIKGYTMGSTRSCNTTQINFARNVMNHAYVPVKPTPPKLPYKTVNSGINIKRTGGKDRYETSQLIANTNWTNGPLFIATGKVYADALTVGPAVAATNGNLLLINKDLNATSLNFIKSKKPSKIYVIGESGAISDNAFNQLSKISETVRIGGRDRYDTSIAVNKEFFNGTETALVATGTNYPDALSASAVGGTIKQPVYLVNNAVSTKVNQAMKSNGVKKLTIVGGTGAVPTSSFNQLKVGMASANRVSGNDRYDTSIAVSKLANTKPTTNTYMASGGNYPDALSVGTIAGKKGETLILGRPACLSPSTYNFVKTGAQTIWLAGGSSAINIGTKTATRICN